MQRRQRSVGWSGTLVAGLAIACAGPGCGGGGGSPTGGTGGVGSGLGGATAPGTGGQSGALGGSSGNGGATGTAPGPFALTLPLHGSSAQPLTPMLQWDPANGATAYRVEIAATGASFGTADVVDQTVSGTTTSFMVASSALTAGVIYQWRVTATNGAGATVATGAPRRFSSPYAIAGAHGIGVTPDGAKLVVASDVNNGPIAIITLASHAVTASISTGVASQPMGIAVSPDGTQALATLLTNGSGGVNGVAVIDVAHGTLVRNISDPCVGTTLSDVAYLPGGTEAVIPDLSAGCSAMGMSRFSLGGGSSFTFVNFNDTNDPFGVAVTADGTTALVTMELTRKVYKVALPSTVSPISIPSTSAGIAVSPDGSTAVVAGNDVYFIRLADGSVTTLPLTSDAPGSDFHNVAVTADGSKAVVVGGSTIQVLSLASRSVMSSYPATSGTSVALSPDGATAFVTDQGNGWVRVLQIP
jgi:DNA-binding beta-propeller fold protein YncE